MLSKGGQTMKKCFLLVIAMLLLLVSCGQTETTETVDFGQSENIQPTESVDYLCDICGDDHRNLEQLNGVSSRHEFFSVWSHRSHDSLRIYIESCWSGSVTPQYQLHFIARYDIAELYAALSVAQSNVPFGVTFDGQTITLTTDILGLEEVYITLAERQYEVGFAYDIRRHGE